MLTGNDPESQLILRRCYGESGVMNNSKMVGTVNVTDGAKASPEEFNPNTPKKINN